MPSEAGSHSASHGDIEKDEGQKKSRQNLSSARNTEAARTKGIRKKSSHSHVDEVGSRRVSAASVTSRILSGRKQTEDFDLQTKRVTFMSTDLEQYGLKIHNLSFHGLTQVPMDTFKVKDIGELDLSENNLRSIPPEIRYLQQLRVLNVMRTSIRASSPNDFTGLPRELSRLPFLHSLSLSECNLRHVPAAVFMCVSLRHLDISRNKLQRLAPEIGNLVNLEILGACETGVTGLPPEIAYCERLQDIDLYGNALESLPETMRELHNLRRLKINARSFQNQLDDYATKMIRAGQIRSEHTPHVLFEIPELENLDLDGTKINCIPERCGCHLLELRLSNNYFLAMPKGLKSLTSIVTLDLSNNFLTSLPDDFGVYVPSVCMLSLAGNQIERLPASFSDLVNVVEIDLSRNRLSQLPSTIGALSCLRTLRVRGNRLSALPETLCDLVELQTLDMTNNCIIELPVRMHELRKISSMHTYSHMRAIGLWLHKNPIVEPPEHVWKTVNVRTLFSYLRKLQIRRTENLQPLKMIVLGERGCGKTTLLSKLATGKATNSLDPEQPTCYLSKNEITEKIKALPHDYLLKMIESSESTSLASISSWQTENDIRICSFDLSGADVYEAVYPQLLDPKALYILAYDAREYHSQHYEARIGRWLELLNLHAPGAVVKLVATRADAVTADMSVANAPSCMAAEEHIAQHLSAYKDKLLAELEKVEMSIDECSKDDANKKEEAGTDILDFDPMANLLHMQRRKKQIKDLIDTPLRIINGIAVCHREDDVVGIQELVAEIERLAINKKMFPHAQCFVPAVWRKLRNAIKKKPSFYILWEQVTELAEKHKLYDEYLMDCLTFLHETGDIMWLADNATLQKYIFHKPKKLVHVLRGILNHDMGAIVDYNANKAFSSYGKLSKEQFEEAKGCMLAYGEISRQMLISLWFYLQPTHDEIMKMIEMVSALGLGYVVPQPNVPSATAFKDPFLVMPWYVRDDDLDGALEPFWTRKLPIGQREIQIAYSFPVQHPVGAFEKLCTRLQDDAEERLDWQNTVYIFRGNENKLLLRRIFDSDKSKSRSLTSIEIKVRSPQLRDAYQIMTKTHHAWAEILHSMTGLIWDVAKFTVAKKD